MVRKQKKIRKTKFKLVKKQINKIKIHDFKKLICKIRISKNLLRQYFNKWKKFNDFDEGTVSDESGKKSKRITKKVKYTKNITNIKIAEVKINLNVTLSIDTEKLKAEEEKRGCEYGYFPRKTYSFGGR